MPPSVAKVFSDLNPIWDSHGRISIRQYSARTLLIYIPSEDTRKWVLDVAFWQAGNCAFSVSKWSSSVNLAPKPLLAAPVWVVLRNVPPPLFTYEGLSVIGSAIGDPLYTEKPNLVLNPLGMVKIKVILQLETPFPPSVRVVDKMGNSIIVGAEYLRVPPKCECCGEFGHLILRCPSQSTKLPNTTVASSVAVKSMAPPLSYKKTNVAGSKQANQLNVNPPIVLEKVLVKSKSVPSLIQADVEGCSTSAGQIDLKGWTVFSKRSKQAGLSSISPIPGPSQGRGVSLAKTSSKSPSRVVSEGTSSVSLGNLEAVVARSKHVPLSPSITSLDMEVDSLTSSMVHEEEEGIKLSQSRIRLLDQAMASQGLQPEAGKTSKKKRQKLRKALFLQTNSTVVEDPVSLSNSSEPLKPQGRSLSRTVSPEEH